MLVIQEWRTPLGGFHPHPVLRGHVPIVHLCKKDCLEILHPKSEVFEGAHRIQACVSEGSQFERVDPEHVEEWTHAVFPAEN